MAAPFPSFVPPEPVIEAYVAALQAARPRQDTFAVQRASLLLAGLDRPEVDITLRAFAATLQPREEWERGASPRTLGRALDLHGAERVLRLTEDAWDLHAFAGPGSPPDPTALRGAGARHHVALILLG